MADGWAYYDAFGERVRPGSNQAVFRGREVSTGTGVPAPAGHGLLGTVHYVDVHVIGNADRQTFTSGSRFRFWCRGQDVRRVIMPSTRERKALQNISGGDWCQLGDLLNAGEKTRREMEDKAWIEFGPHPVSGGPRVRITPRGGAALAGPKAPKVIRSPKIKMLESRMSTVDTRIAKPPRK